MLMTDRLTGWHRPCHSRDQGGGQGHLYHCQLLSRSPALSLNHVVCLFKHPLIYLFSVLSPKTKSFTLCALKLVMIPQVALVLIRWSGSYPSPPCEFKHFDRLSWIYLPISGCFYTFINWKLAIDKSTKCVRVSSCKWSSSLTLEVQKVRISAWNRCVRSCK